MHPEPPHFVSMIRTASSMFCLLCMRDASSLSDSSVHVRTCPSRVVPSAANEAADGVCASHSVQPVLVGPFAATRPPALGTQGRACFLLACLRRPVHTYSCISSGLKGAHRVLVRACAPRADAYIIPMLLHPEPQG